MKGFAFRPWVLISGRLLACALAALTIALLAQAVR